MNIVTRRLTVEEDGMRHLAEIVWPLVVDFLSRGLDNPTRKSELNPARRSPNAAWPRSVNHREVPK
jgi:hypothetical protein